MVEGTPLLREHAVMSCIEGSNPSISANRQYENAPLGAFFISALRDALAARAMTMAKSATRERWRVGAVVSKGSMRTEFR